MLDVVIYGDRCGDRARCALKGCTCAGSYLGEKLKSLQGRRMIDAQVDALSVRCPSLVDPIRIRLRPNKKQKAQQ